MSECYDKAALRHYTDAEHLAEKGRYDNAGHLIGFAAECAIKHVFAITQAGTPPHIHLPDLAKRVLVLVKGRNARHLAMSNLLNATRDAFFHDWDVAMRYGMDNMVDSDKYKKWKMLAARVINAAGL